jgi:hypothetical protein
LFGLLTITDGQSLFLAVVSSHVQEKQHIRLGTNDKINVAVNGYPMPSFTWKKNGQPFNGNTGRYRAQADGTIMVTDVKVVDRGNYSVHISQLAGRQSTDIKIEVIVFGENYRNVLKLCTRDCYTVVIILNNLVNNSN